MKLSAADYLRSRPTGAQQWLDTFGASMSPFLQSGDALLVERGGALESGDIAVLARGDGALIAHLVTAAAPLRTSTLMGTEDSAGLEPLGRAVRVRARGVELPMGAALRTSLLASHAVLKTGRARQVVHRVLSAASVRALRRELLRPEVRTLHDAEAPLARRALGDLGTPFSLEVLDAAFARGAVVAAVARGRALALAAVVPAAAKLASFSLSGVRASGRGLDLEARLISLAIVEARALGIVRLQVARVAPQSEAALRAAGFASEAAGSALALTLAATHEGW